MIRYADMGKTPSNTKKYTLNNLQGTVVVRQEYAV